MKDEALNNLLIGIAATLVLLLGLPALLGVMGWGHAPTGKSWGILVAACFGIIAKLVASETASGEFEFYKLGYDFCTTALGGVITALAIQLSSSEDMFPGFSATDLPNFGKSVVDARTIHLVGAFGLAWLFVLLTARVCRGVKDEKIKPRGGKALFSAALGGFTIGLYALILAAKG